MPTGVDACKLNLIFETSTLVEIAFLEIGLSSLFQMLHSSVQLTVDKQEI